MDPITKALHETWKNIVTEGQDKNGAIIGGLKDPYDDLERGPNGRWRLKQRQYFPNQKPGVRVPQEVIDYISRKPTTPGVDYRPPQPGDAGPGGYNPPDYNPPGGWRPGPRPTIFPEPKPKPAPTPGDGSWGGSKPKPGTGAWGGDQPKTPKYGTDGNFIGFSDGTTPTPTPTRKKDEFIPYINPNPSPYPDYYEKKPMYNSVTGSLPTIRKVYEERDAEGQMAKGELMVLASKAQELANMMKDDTQLEAWVQSKITKAKDYISSVHDYMNGNPDKID